MPRFVSSVETSCRVCGSAFAVQHDYDAQEGRVTTEPRECPVCTAPVRFVARPAVGEAKALVMTLGGVPAYVSEHRSATDLLRKTCARPEDVDEYVDLVARMDYDAWEKMNRDLDRGRTKLSAAERQETKSLPKLRELAASGELARRLREPAATVKGDLLAEREHYLRIFDERKGQP